MPFNMDRFVSSVIKIWYYFTRQKNNLLYAMATSAHLHLMTLLHPHSLILVIYYIMFAFSFSCICKCENVNANSSTNISEAEIPVNIQRYGYDLTNFEHRKQMSMIQNNR